MVDEKQIKDFIEKLKETQDKRVSDIEGLQKVRKDALDKINKIKEEYDFTRGQLDALTGITQPMPEPAPAPPLEEVEEAPEPENDSPEE